jgi:ribosome-associated protein
MDIRKKQRMVVDALEDVKGRDIQVFDTARMPSMFERVVIASGDSTRQWVLVDLGDIVVHIMHPTVREFYNLEEVWGGKKVRFSKSKPVGKKATRAKAARPRRKR